MNKQEKPLIRSFSKISTLSLGILISSLISFELYASESSPKTDTTTVYKVVHPDGSVSYSDQAQTNAIKLEVAPVATVPAYAPIKHKATQTTKSNAAHYQSINILNPSNGTSFHSGSGSITVSTKIEPSLRPEDQLRFLLDGSEVKTQRASSLELNNLNRGTHSVSVEVLNQDRQVLISSSSQFTVHRPIARPK